MSHSLDLLAGIRGGERQADPTHHDDVRRVIAVQVGQRRRRLARGPKRLRVAALQRPVVHGVEELPVLPGASVRVGHAQPQRPPAAREPARVEGGEPPRARPGRRSRGERPPRRRLLTGADLESPGDGRAPLGDPAHGDPPALRLVPVGRDDVRHGRDAPGRDAADRRERVDAAPSGEQVPAGCVALRRVGQVGGGHPDDLDHLVGRQVDAEGAGTREHETGGGGDVRRRG